MFSHYHPLNCPHCQADLTINGAVKVELTDGRKVWQRLHTVITGVRHDDYPDYGQLSDPSGEIERGLHSESFCGKCGESLVDVDIAETTA